MGLVGRPDRFVGWLLVVAVGAMTVFWAVNPVAGKLALRSFPAMLLISLRTMVAAVIVLVAARLLGQRPLSVVERSDWRAVLPIGLFGQVGNQVAFLVGLSMTSVGHSAFLIALTPVWILLLAAARGIERIRAAKLAGMALAIAGVMWLATESARAGESGGPSVLGDLITLASSWAFAGMAVFGKEYRSKYPTMTIPTVAYCAGAVALAPVVAWFWMRGFAFGEVGWGGWGMLLYLAAVPAVACYLIFYWALRFIDASRLGALAYLQPPIATATGVLVLAEPVTGTLLAAGALILVGVGLAERW